MALGKYPEQITEELDSRQIGRWRAYYQLNPFIERSDYMLAQILNLLYAIHKDKNAKNIPVSEWIPEWGKEPESEKERAIRLKQTCQRLHTMYARYYETKCQSRC